MSTRARYLVTPTDVSAPAPMVANDLMDLGGEVASYFARHRRLFDICKEGFRIGYAPRASSSSAGRSSWLPVNASWVRRISLRKCDASHITDPKSNARPADPSHMAHAGALSQSSTRPASLNSARRSNARPTSCATPATTRLTQARSYASRSCRYALTEALMCSSSAVRAVPTGRPTSRSTSDFSRRRLLVRRPASQPALTAIAKNPSSHVTPFSHMSADRSLTSHHVGANLRIRHVQTGAAWEAHQAKTRVSRSCRSSAKQGSAEQWRGQRSPTNETRLVRASRVHSLRPIGQGACR